MNDNAKKWVVALRSGEYNQAQGTLRKEDARCCLGVACDIYAKEHDVDWEYRTGPGWTFLGLNSVLPFEVREWLGLGSDDGESRVEDLENLANLNDTGHTFEQIARIIEEEPEGLFV